MNDIAIAILAVIIFLSGYGLGYITGGLKSKNSMKDNIFSNMTEEERKLAWMYKIFDKDMIKAKTEQWTKEAEKAGMTLTEYLESISPLNDKKNYHGAESEGEE